MPKRSKSNSAYPKYWRLRKRGNIYTMFYRVPPTARYLWGNKKEVVLGKGKTAPSAEKAAYELWAKCIASDLVPDTLQQLFDRYLAEVVPTKAKKTQELNQASLMRLRKAHLNIAVADYETYMAFQYKNECAKQKSEKIANSDIEVLFHAFTKAFEWGVPIKEHPIKGKVSKFPRQARDRYIEDWELDQFLSVANNMLKVYVPLKVATGKDQSMLLDVKLSDIKSDGLHFPKRKKTQGYANSKASLMPFSDSTGASSGLRELIEDALSWREKLPHTDSEHLFITRSGKPYYDGENNSAFKSMWQRAMRKALSDTDLNEKFTEHDLCSKTASDVETVEEDARLRGHTNTKTTHQNYRVKPEIVMPAKLKK